MLNVKLQNYILLQSHILRILQSAILNHSYLQKCIYLFIRNNQQKLTNNYHPYRQNKKNRMVNQQEDQKQQQKILKRPKQDDDSYEVSEVDSDPADQQIPNDGQKSSQHSSIDLQEYLKNRDNIPSQPSDLEDDDQEQQDQQQDQDQDSQQQSQDRKKVKRGKKQQKTQKQSQKLKK